MPRSSRLRSYSTVLAGALCFGLLGAAFERATFAISPEYFTFGDTPYGHASDWTVTWIGFAAGVPLGTLCTGLVVWRRAAGRPVRSARLLGSASLAILMVSAIAAVFLLVVDPFAVRAESARLMMPEAATPYLLCWSLRAGVYLGTILGVAIVTGRAARKATVDDD